MNNFGFIKTAAAVPFGLVGAVDHNKSLIIKMIKEAVKNEASLIVFPELTITGYTCQDLFHNSKLIEQSFEALLEIARKTKDEPILALIGLPVLNNHKLYNCAAAVNRGKILGIIPKTYLPGYREFYEPRWFGENDDGYFRTVLIKDQEIPFGDHLLFQEKEQPDFIIGVEICEDLWVAIPPSTHQALAGATVICNLSASNILVAKSEYRRELVKSQSSRCYTAYLYASSGVGESTTDIVFDADAVIMENGVLLSESIRFARENQIIYADIDLDRLTAERRIQKNKVKLEKKFDLIQFSASTKFTKINRQISPFPFVPSDEKLLTERCNEIFNIQATGLARRLESLPGFKAVIGISGGLDSTLALLVTIKAFQLLNKKNDQIIAVTMPGFGTTDRTLNNAVALCEKLGIFCRQIPIKDISELMFTKAEQDPSDHNTVYENVQARARTYLLMTLANKFQAIVIGTGDLSEIALGWSTYNGDHISMYNVNASVPKTLVKFLVKWVAEHELELKTGKILLDILAQPISPELLPAKQGEITQKTEEKIGPYELHDFFLYYFIRFGFSPRKILFLTEQAFAGQYSRKVIKEWLKVFLKRFIQNQWKRDCVPAGPKVGSIDLSPRGTWRMAAEIDPDFLIKDIE